MNQKRIFLLFGIFILSTAKGQQFDLNKIKIDDVKNILGNVLGKKENSESSWSGIPGDPNFNVADRIAIKEVIDAYGIYWDTNNLEGFLSLFTEDAIDLSYGSNNERLSYKIKEKIKNSRERMDYFEENAMQRRHMMSNTLFLELTEDSAYINQYMTLLTTDKKNPTKIVTPIFYDFKLKKTEGIWKISYREIILDRPLDMALER